MKRRIMIVATLMVAMGICSSVQAQRPANAPQRLEIEIGQIVEVFCHPVTTGPLKDTKRVEITAFFAVSK